MPLAPPALHLEDPWTYTESPGNASLQELPFVSLIFMAIPMLLTSHGFK